MRDALTGNPVWQAMGLALGLFGCEGVNPDFVAEAPTHPELHTEADGVLPDLTRDDRVELRPQGLFMAGIVLEGAHAAGAWIADAQASAPVSDADWAQRAGLVARGRFAVGGQGLVVATPEPELDGLSTLHHVRDGHATPFAVVAHDALTDLAAGDLDGDGLDELVVVTGDAAWVHDDASAGFERLGGFPAGFAREDADGRTRWVRGRGLRADVGDVTGDGLADLVLAAVGPEDEALLVVWPGQADAAFGFAPEARLGATLEMTQYTPAVDAVDVTVADLDGDGRPEAALAAVGMAATTASRRHVYLGAGRIADGALRLDHAEAFARLPSPGQGRSANAHLRSVQVASAQLTPDAGRTLVVDNHLFDLEEGALVHRGEWVWDGLFTAAPMGQPLDCEGDAGTHAGDLSAGADYRIATGDFDEDGLDELAVVGVGMCAVGVFEGYADGGRLSRVVPLAVEVARGDTVALTALALDP